jgi:hypothetical protein
MRHRLLQIWNGRRGGLLEIVHLHSRTVEEAAELSVKSRWCNKENNSTCNPVGHVLLTKSATKHIVVTAFSTVRKVPGLALLSSPSLLPVDAADDAGFHA